MQNDAVSGGEFKARINAIANREIPADYRARSPIETVINLVAAIAICSFALLLGNREPAYVPAGVGAIVGCSSYAIIRLAYGRRLFFAKKGWSPARLITIAFALAIPVGAMLFPGFLGRLYDAVWFLVAIGAFIALQAAEGLMRREWEALETV